MYICHLEEKIDDESVILPTKMFIKEEYIEHDNIISEADLEWVTELNILMK